MVHIQVCDKNDDSRTKKEIPQGSQDQIAPSSESHLLQFISCGIHLANTHMIIILDSA